MKLSELIEVLKTIQESNGNIDVKSLNKLGDPGSDVMVAVYQNKYGEKHLYVLIESL